ncbi:MAG: metallophosphoesterase family protein [Planctomycetota bacterium]
MRTLALGDIHGCLTALEALAQAVPFRPDDQLVLLGDYVDKGPNTRGTLDWLCRLSQRAQVIALRGNHDQMMLDARHDRDAFDDWIASGGDATLRSYRLPLNLDAMARVPERHWRFLENTTLIHVADQHFFVHGNADPARPLDQQLPRTLLWEKCYAAEPHPSGKTMVCGHASQKDGLVLDLGFALCIDTWACGDGYLTAYDPTAERFWQANRAGQTQTGQRL